jgi:hypothetical protein
MGFNDPEIRQVPTYFKFVKASEDVSVCGGTLV